LGAIFFFMASGWPNHSASKSSVPSAYSRQPRSAALFSAIKPNIDVLDAHHFHVAPELIRRVLLDAGELP
jgi:hypothetical protein